ncbi:MAG TPA: SMC-Scp complex subunit ScpB [Actinomycetota bacterium]
MSELRRQLEAILFVADEPIPLTQLAQVTETAKGTVAATLGEMRADLEASGSGLVLREVGEGWRMYTHPDTAPYVERFVLAVQNPRLTRAALETLAIVAYKQPVSRQQIASIRGVDSDGVVTTLVQRGLVKETGRDEGPGQAVLYGTTPLFLERMGLRVVADLPPIASMLPAQSVADELEP